jgi:hypothetical protein
VFGSETEQVVAPVDVEHGLDADQLPPYHRIRVVAGDQIGRRDEGRHQLTDLFGQPVDVVADIRVIVGMAAACTTASIPASAESTTDQLVDEAPTPTV